jgi:uncharacterized OsmC-like protein
MLLQAVAACAGVTLKAVATSLGVKLRGGRVIAEGDLDFRGTLGIDRDVPVGFKQIRLHIELHGDVTDEQRGRLLEMTQRYCVVYQTLLHGSDVSMQFANI